MDVTVGAAAHAAAFWTALNLILLVILSARVVGQRRKHRVALGDGGVPELNQAIRVFGNATEYVPTGIAAIAILTIVGASALIVHLAGVMLLAGRIAHAVGLSRSSGATPARVAGILLSWLAYILTAVVLLFYAIP